MERQLMALRHKQRGTFIYLEEHVECVSNCNATGESAASKTLVFSFLF